MRTDLLVELLNTFHVWLQSTVKIFNGVSLAHRFGVLVVPMKKIEHYLRAKHYRHGLSKVCKNKKIKMIVIWFSEFWNKFTKLQLLFCSLYTKGGEGGGGNDRRKLNRCCLQGLLKSAVPCSLDAFSRRLPLSSRQDCKFGNWYKGSTQGSLF